MSALKKKSIILKVARHPSTYKIPCPDQMKQASLTGRSTRLEYKKILRFLELHGPHFEFN